MAPGEGCRNLRRAARRFPIREVRHPQFQNGRPIRFKRQNVEKEFILLSAGV
jgi:hypothetical protein